MIAAKISVRLMLLGSAAAVKRRFCAAVAATSLPADAAVATSLPADAAVATSLPADAAVATSLPADAAVAMADGTKEKQDSRTLFRRLSSLRGAPQGSATRTLNKWLREGKSVRAVELIKYVKEFRKFHRYAHGLEIMDWMENTKGINMSFTNHAIRLDLIDKVRGTEAAEKYFSNLPEPAKNERTYGSLLNCYCSEKNKNADKAISLYNEMKNRNIPSNILAHISLMSLYMKLCQYDKVLTQYQEMKSDNIVPDYVIYCILMNCYASLNDIESVERIIKEAEEDDKVRLHWSAYSTLAAIYCSAGLPTKAENALKKLETLIDARDHKAYDYLISLYAKINNVEEVKRIWKSLKTIFPKPCNLSYLNMLRALDKFDDISGQQDLYEEWQSVCTLFDVRLANLLIGSYLRKDMIQQAQSLWEKSSKRGAIPDFKTCFMFLDHFLQKNDMNSALVWLETAASSSSRKQDRWKLSQDQLDTFLKAFEDAKDVEGAEKFCECLRKLGHLDLNAYEKLLQTYLAANLKNPKIRQRIKDDKIQLNSQTNKLLEMVCGDNE